MKVLICDKVETSAVEKMRNGGLTVDDKSGITAQDLLNVVGDYDIMVVRSATKATKEVIEKGKNLKLIVRGGVGMDNIDAEAAKKANIKVENTPEASSISVAELTIGLMFALARKITIADSTMKSGKWEKKRLNGTELYKKTLGLVGVGRIGFETAKRAIALGMSVVGYDPYLNPVPEHISKAGIKMVKTVDEIYSQSDYISLHMPKTKETAGMINAEAFKKMKKTAYILNCARGGIIAEKDLAEALKTGTIAGAAIDVYEKEPISPDNPLLTVGEKIILLPHLGASSDEGQSRVGDAVTINTKPLEGNIYLVLLDGILNNETSETLRKAFDDLIESRIWKFVVDLSGVSYMGSPGIGLFISLLDTLDEHKGTIVFINPQENVKEVFKLFQLSTFYSITNTLQDAIKELKGLSH